LLPLDAFPVLDAALNLASAILLALGFFFIRRREIGAHRACMLSAIGTSTLFLVCYVWYHAHHGVTRFPGQGGFRAFYFALLTTHTILAAAIVPLVIVTLVRALRRTFDRHKRIARWALPLWFYVSITGVVVYWMLYQVRW
jgi:uncharacterized membrane protein YozB (DUF420 family)